MSLVLAVAPSPPRRSPLGRALDEPSPPVELLSAAAALREAGHRPVLAASPFSGGSTVDLLEAILAQAPSLVLLWVESSAWPGVPDLCRRLRRLRELRVVLLGRHPAAVPRSCLITAPAAHCAVSSGGEEVVVEVVNRLRAGAELPGVGGVALREDGEVQLSPRGGDDRFTPPTPAWDLLRGWRGASSGPPARFDLRVVTEGDRRRTPSMSPRELGRRFRSCQSEFHPRLLRLVDRDLSGDPGWLSELCRQLATPVATPPWSCGLDPAAVDPCIAQDLARGGCERVRFELPDISGPSLAHLRRVFAALREHGVRLEGELVVGRPGSSEAAVRAAVGFAMRQRLDRVKVRLYRPAPGSTLAEEPDADALIQAALRPQLAVYRPEAYRSLADVEHSWRWARLALAADPRRLRSALLGAIPWFGSAA